MDGANSEIMTFVPCVYSRDDIVEWRAIQGKRVEHGWVLAQDLPKEIPVLDRHNAAGLNIYVGANPRKERNKMGDDNVATCRTAFVDFDKLDPEAGCSADEIACARIEAARLPDPTLRIFSGHGIHCYWRLLCPLKPSEWTKVQMRLIATLGTDRVIKNPERIMRLPGFENCKSEPRVPCFIIHADRGRCCDVSDLLDHCADLDDAPPLPETPALPRPPILEAKARAMLYAAKWPVCAEGERNNVAYLHACQLTCDFSLADDDALEILRTWNDGNHPPLPDEELLQAFGSAKKGAKHLPGSKLTAPRKLGASQPQRPKLEPQPQATASPAATLKAVLDDTISGKRRTVEWPWPVLGEYTEALLDGTVTILCGAKGATKTFFMLQSMTHWIDCGERAAMLVMEEDAEHCLRRCLAQKSGLAGVTRSRWVKEHPTEAVQAWEANREVLDRIGAHLYDLPESDISLPQVAKWIEARIADKYRIIIVDPITAAVQTSDPWIQDAKFVNGVKRLARQAGVSIVLTTHPRKGGADMIDMDSLAGSAAYVRFAQTVLWLEAYPDDKRVTIRTCVGRDQQTANRALHILAARNSMGRGKRIGYLFSGETLTFQEIGLVVKESKDE
ncbi:MAG: hypothetical protein EHM35_02700 [Planctomycetaceae bacterium]|nr:MAG: hypothetical protein EHM35_02700 [Planctomycetaceae bacterium]